MPLPKRTRTNEGLRTHYLAHLYAKEAPPAGMNPTCQRPHCTSQSPLTALYRCEDCFGRQIYCLECINTSHTHLPFHRIRTWEVDGPGHFEPSDPMGRRFALYLGHGGHPCSYQGAIVKMYIMHTNGIHIMNVVFCGCRAQSFWKQLLDADLFPATDEHPQTAFTFAVLKHFHILNLCGKTSHHDFNQAVRQMTSGAFLEGIPVRRSTTYMKPFPDRLDEPEPLPPLRTGDAPVASPADSETVRCLECRK